MDSSALQVGDDQVRRKPGPGANPYAALLATSRIEALETHRSSAIAKRASRIWKQVAHPLSSTPTPLLLLNYFS